MTLGSATKDFAFSSGATKSPSIRDHEPLRALQFSVLLFAFRPNCEIKGRYFAAGDTNVDTVGEFGPGCLAPRIRVAGVLQTPSFRPNGPRGEFANSIHCYSPP